jgi:hypothetical protein
LIASTSAIAAPSRHVGAAPPVPLLLALVEVVVAVDPPDPPDPPAPPVLLDVVGSMPVVVLVVLVVSGGGKIWPPSHAPAATAALPIIIIVASARAAFPSICFVIVVSVEALARASRSGGGAGAPPGSDHEANGWKGGKTDASRSRHIPPTPEVADGLDAAGLLAPGSSSGGPSRIAAHARAQGLIQW